MAPKMPKSKKFKKSKSKPRSKAKAPYKRRAPAKRRVASKAKLYQNISGAVNTSMVKMVHAPKGVTRAIKKVGSPNVFSNNFGFVQSSALGLQNYLSIEHGSMGDIQALRANIASTGSDSGVRFVLESYISEMTFTNASNASIEFELYDVVPKRDIIGVSNYNAPSGSVLAIPGTPDQYWEAGSRINGNQLVTPVPPSKIPSAVPSDSQLFRDYFYVKRKTSVILTQGGIHRHVVTNKMNFLVDDSMILLDQRERRGLKGLTTYTMLVQRGLPATVTQPTMAPQAVLPISQLAFVATRRFKYTFVQDNSNGLYPSNNLLTTLATGSSGPNVLSLGSGLIAPVALTA